MDEVGKILPSLIGRQIGSGEPQVLEVLISLWPRIAGKTMAQHSQPARFAAGVLTLAADGATWGTQLQYLAKDICAGINGFLGRALVKKLRIQVVAQASLFVPPRPLRDTAVLVPPVVEGAVDVGPIRDREIASAVETSYAKYFSRPRR